MDTPKITTEDRLHCVFCHRPMSETAFLRRKVARGVTRTGRTRLLRLIYRSRWHEMCGNVGEKYGTVVTYLVFLYTPGRFALERLRDAKFAMSTFLVVH